MTDLEASGVDAGIGGLEGGESDLVLSGDGTEGITGLDLVGSRGWGWCRGDGLGGNAGSGLGWALGIGGDVDGGGGAGIGSGLGGGG